MKSCFHTRIYNNFLGVSCYAFVYVWFVLWNVMLPCIFRSSWMIRDASCLFMCLSQVTLTLPFTVQPWWTVLKSSRCIPVCVCTWIITYSIVCFIHCFQSINLAVTFLLYMRCNVSVLHSIQSVATFHTLMWLPGSTTEPVGRRDLQGEGINWC